MARSIRNRLIASGVNSFIKGPAGSWVFSTAAIATFNFIRGRAGKREIIDLSGAGVGSKYVIEHLPITHKEQMKQMKAEAKRQKKAAKLDGRAAKARKRPRRRHEKQVPQVGPPVARSDGGPPSCIERRSWPSGSRNQRPRR